MQIAEAGAKGRKNLLATYIPNTAQRFKSCVDFIRSNGVTPGTILLLHGDQGYDVIDGNHRVAALLVLQSQVDTEAPAKPVEAWVAR